MNKLRVLILVTLGALSAGPLVRAQNQLFEIRMGSFGGGRGDQYATLPAIPTSFGTLTSARLEAHGSTTHSLYFLNPSLVGVNVDVLAGMGVSTFKVSGSSFSPLASVSQSYSLPFGIGGPTSGSTPCLWTGGIGLSFPGGFSGSAQFSPFTAPWPTQPLSIYFYPTADAVAVYHQSNQPYSLQCALVSPVQFSMTFYATISHGPNFIWIPPAGVQNLGNSLSSPTGTPALMAQTTHQDGAPTWLVLTGGTPQANAWLVIALSVANVPLLGGVCVPDPAGALLWPVQLDGNGQLSLDVPWPAGLPASTFVVQVWIYDPTVAQAWSASNAVRI